MMMDGASGGGNTNQFIGSKISLISKSEIRYEGILYSLDLEEATISLQKVRSFGTEDRETSRPVPPKNEVYEFIIFRGSDIKGIDVLEPPPQGKESAVDEEPVDPAIVEVQHYHPQPSQQQQPPQPPQQAQQPAPIGSLGMNDHRERFGTSFVGMGPPSGGSSMIGTSHHLGGQAGGIHQGFSLGVGFSNSSGVASGGAVGQSVPAQQQQQPRAPSPPLQNNESASKSLGSPPSPDIRSDQNKRNSTGSNNTNRRSYAPRGRGGGGDRGGMMNNSRGGGSYNPRGGNRGANSYNNAYYTNRYSANGGQGPPRNYFRRGELKGNKKLTFDGEFDFEKANEELQKALTKIKIADGGKEDGEEDEVHHEEDRASEDGEGSVDKENESKNFYQKDNFFDNISCEALERKSGKREKPDWRAERKLNAETFGLPLKPGMRGGGGSSTYYRGGGYHHAHYNTYNNYRGGYGGYSRGGGGGSSYHRGGGGYRGGTPRGGYGNRPRGGGSSERGVGANKVD